MEVEMGVTKKPDQPEAPAGEVARGPQAHFSDMNVSGKTLFQVAVFALAGVMGGGGVSLAATPKEELAALKHVIETVALSVNEIGVDLRYAREDREKLHKRVDDHEQRLRAREACVCRPRQ